MRSPFLVGSVFVACFVFAAAASAGPISDADRSAARTLAEEGLRAFDAGDYEAALPKLRRADDVVGLPTTGLLVARDLEKLGRWVEASEKYLAVARLAPDPSWSDAQQAAVKFAATDRARLLPLIPTLAIELDASVAGARVVVDGEPIAAALIGEKRPLSPGKHRVSVTSGSEALEREVTLTAGASERMRFASKGISTDASVAGPRATSDGSRDGMRKAYLGAGVLGGASLVAGFVVGALAASARHDLDAQGCVDGHCPSRLEGNVDHYMTLRTASTALVYGGGALGLAGAGLFLALPARAPTSLAIRLDPAGLAVEGSFR
jgi:hypothetical protein